ncbi:MAG: glucose-1-phosphate adenylyltransferase subunit GlgD [Eubacterium sp.]|nr:glucose-1-phosphate adenylyltransferase subunit GlgD [Eubacterium sp.]
MRVLGLIFSNIHDRGLPEMTAWRTIASVPVAARYRMIDFVLSGCVSSGIFEIGIITKTKYNSLMKHVGNGKDWDLDRKNGGVTIIAPYVEAQSGPLYTNRLEAMMNAISFIESSDADYVLLTDCDLLANIPYADIVEQHIASGADVTAAYKPTAFRIPVTREAMGFEINSEGRITNAANFTECSGQMNFSLNIWVMKRPLLLSILRESRTYGYRSFSRDVLPRHIPRVTFMGYKYEGYARSITSLNEYFLANMDTLDAGIRAQLFDNQDYPVFTRVKDSAPTKYGDRACVRNSFISDGCTINGTVENCVLFRGVRVDEGAVLRNCVILNDSIIENDVSMDYIVTDKRVLARRGRTVAGCEGHPFFIGRGEAL